MTDYLNRARTALANGFTSEAARKEAITYGTNRAYEDARDEVMKLLAGTDSPLYWQFPSAHAWKAKHAKLFAAYPAFVAIANECAELREQIKNAPVNKPETKAQKNAKALSSGNPIAKAIAPLKNSAMDTAGGEAIIVLNRAMDAMEKAGWDLDVIAPEGNWRKMGREDYLAAQNRRGFYSMLFARNRETGKMERDFAREELFIKNAREAAAASFDAYAAKLVMKIGDTVEAKLNGTAVWNYSELTVVLPSGEKQVWQTQMIINFSVYGKPYNQWPTRQLSR